MLKAVHELELLIIIAVSKSIFKHPYQSLRSKPLKLLVLISNFISHGLARFVPYINSIIQHRVFKVKPEQAIVRLSMNALLFDLYKQVLVVCKYAVAHHLKERVAILRGEKDCKLKVLSCFVKILET